MGTVDPTLELMDRVLLNTYYSIRSKRLVASFSGSACSGVFLRQVVTASFMFC